MKEKEFKEREEELENTDSGVDREHGMFDVVVGNPPYQEGESGKVNDAIYHNFMLTAQSVGRNVSLIYPARWLTGGRGAGIDDFRETELSSKHYVRFVLDPRKDFFDNVDIEGGINYFLWSHLESDSVEYVYGKDEIEKRGTLLNGKSVFIRETRFSKISEKIGTKKSLSPTKTLHYGPQLSADYKIEAFAEQVVEDTETVEIYYSGKGGGVRKETIPKNATKRDTGGYKVFLAKTAHPANDSLRRPGRVFTGTLNEICSISFIAFNHLKTMKEAENLVKYLKTDFAMFLLGIITPTQNATAKVYRLIPDVNPATGEIYDKPGTFLDFSGNSDDLDNQLAEIYGLTDEDRAVIRENIRPWKDKNSLTADGLF